MKKLCCALLALCLLLPACLSNALAESETGTIDYFSYFIVAIQEDYDDDYLSAYDELTEQERFAGALLHDGIAMMSESSKEMQWLLLDVTSTEDVKALINNGFIDVDHPGCEPMDDVLARLAEIFEEKGLEMPELYYIQHFDLGYFNREEGWRCSLGHMEEVEGEMMPIVDYEVYLTGEDMELAAFAEGMLDF